MVFLIEKKYTISTCQHNVIIYVMYIINSFTENRFEFCNANDVKLFHSYVNWATVIEHI